ncbi:DUF1007 family protein [Salinispira pacifica]|uniref:DUF1007 family protein n=1 Tax=Salinispira pacifica TaxID=1307761 RepID=V5WKT1_9SPIO|nr:DUF1007 family protein [Salinispira pacifica]AHC16149.1 protein of unknown function DUF1007 [Salinispira pacifica]
MFLVNQFFRIFLSAAVIFFLFPLQILSAHPHIWIDVDAVPVEKQGRLEGVRLEWRFDEFYSSGFLVDFDENRDRAFQPEEADAIYREAFRHLQEGGYFSFLQIDGKTLPVDQAYDFHVAFSSGQVVYQFTLPLRLEDVRQLEQGSTLGVTSFDATNYIAFYMIDPGGSMGNGVRLEMSQGYEYSTRELRFRHSGGRVFRSRGRLIRDLR